MYGAALVSLSQYIWRACIPGIPGYLSITLHSIYTLHVTTIHHHIVLNKDWVDFEVKKVSGGFQAPTCAEPPCK